MTKMNIFVNLNRSHFWGFSSGEQRFFRSWVENIVFAILDVSGKGNPLLLSNAANCNSIRPSISVLWKCKTREDNHIWSWKFSFFSLKNFKVVFQKFNFKTLYLWVFCTSEARWGLTRSEVLSSIRIWS